MKKIFLLQDSIISKIAAGEVIERPVYAVKELVENALDAGASSIKVIVEESGLKRITVIDNGEGMSEEDMRDCFKPHTTSKLISEEQLEHISTLGFRGEALSSIAAISDMTINSKIKSAVAGLSVLLHEGTVAKIGSIGMPVGTQITVENLFNAVPARKKFLKSQRTEFRHILDVLTHMAFAYPHVQFTLVHNDKTIFDLPKTTDAIERVNELLGNDIFSSLVPISFEDSYARMHGFLAKPQVTTRTPHKHFVFVNGRKITDRGISLTVKNAYGTLLEKQAYPVCLLFFTMPNEVVDVNVHPRKEEVRFANAQDLFAALELAVKQTLAKYDSSFNTKGWSKNLLLRDTDSYAGKLLKEQQLPWKLVQSNKLNPSQVVQMHNLYLITATEDGMTIIDQHAAHERILYEQYRTAYKEKQNDLDRHTFNPPKVIEVSMTERELLMEHLDMLSSLGFNIESFKGKSFLLRSVPQLLFDRNIQRVITDILENLRMDSGDFESSSKKMISYIACRAAVKAGDSLTQEQSRELLKQLEKTANNATCPHGRPTRIAIDLSMLKKMFKR